MSIEENPVETLKRVKRGTNWMVPISYVSSVSNRREWVGYFPSKATWLKVAAQELGKTTASLRRAIRVIEFIDIVNPLDIPELADEYYLPLASLEVLRRMHDINPQRAISLFEDVVSGYLTLRKTREIYDEEVKKNIGKAGVAKTRGRLQFAFDHAASLAIKNNMDLFTEGTGEFVRRPPKWQFIRPSALLAELEIGKVARFDAIQFGFADRGERIENRMKLLNKVLLISPFFRRTWVVLPHEKGLDLVRQLEEDLALFEMNSVGLVTYESLKEEITPEGVFRFHVRPSGPPVPDLSAKYSESAWKESMK